MIRLRVKRFIVFLIITKTKTCQTPSLYSAELKTFASLSSLMVSFSLEASIFTWGLFILKSNQIKKNQEQWSSNTRQVTWRTLSNRVICTDKNSTYNTKKSIRGNNIFFLDDAWNDMLNKFELLTLIKRGCYL